jgi:site-specific DNA-methyltransferase (adenine-specific)
MNNTPLNVDLMVGDCSKIMRDLEPESVDMVLTSPPYDDLRDYEKIDWTSDTWKSAITSIYRIIRQGGVCVWIVADAVVDGSETGTSFRQALFAKEIGFNLHDTMIWNKGNFTAVGALKTQYAPVFEYMFVWSKGRPKTFNAIKDRPNKHCGSIYHNTLRQKDGSIKDGHGKGRKIIQPYGQRHNVWLAHPEKRNTHRLHPAMFPEGLARDHILSWSNHGDTVLDPFVGSGTTGVVCVENGRNFIGIDISENYIEIARNRIAKAQEASFMKIIKGGVKCP